MEFMVRLHIAWPDSMPPEEVARIREMESRRRRELMAEGTLKRQWRVPGKKEVLMLVETADPTSLHDMLESLPSWPWVEAQVEALATHHLERTPEPGRTP